MYGLLLILLLGITGNYAQAPPKLPNIGYIGYGYNVYYGNPQSTNEFDPGFGKAPIFTLTYDGQQTTPDGKWLVPDGVAVPGSATECSVQGQTTTIQSAFDYQSSLSIDASVDLSGYGASFSASTDYKQVDQSTSTDDDVFVSTSAECQTYLVNVNAYVHPNYSDVIVTQGSLLPTVFNESDAAPFWEFFDLVGTHFSTEIIFGSRWGYSFQSTMQQYTTMQTIGLDVDVAASYAGMVKAGVSLNTSYSRTMASNFTSLTTNVFEYSLGVSPPASGSTEDWLASSLTSTFMDPLQYTLVDVSQLFSTQYTQNADLTARQQAVSDALSQYCENHLIPTGVLSSCARPPQPTPPPPPVGYGAIACGSHNNGELSCYAAMATVYDGLNNIEAQEIVLDCCQGCTIEASISDGNCMAIALGSPGSWAWGLSYGVPDLSEVQQSAQQECQKFTSSCTVVSSGCTSPPPSDAYWGAIACTGGCGSHFDTSQGYPDRIEAHKVAMESLGGGSFIAIDFDQCGAVVTADNGGWSASGGDTPQDATNAAMSACQASHTGCNLLTYACVTVPTSTQVARSPVVRGGGKSMLSAVNQAHEQ